MPSRQPNIWTRLVPWAVGLVIVATFAPLPEPLPLILLLIAGGCLLAYFWSDRRGRKGL
jgi:hypothetical protein